MLLYPPVRCDFTVQFLVHGSRVVSLGQFVRQQTAHLNLSYYVACRILYVDGNANVKGAAHPVYRLLNYTPHLLRVDAAGLVIV